MALGFISCNILFNEIFMELKPRMLEWKTFQDWSFFIKLDLLEHFSEFLFPRLVLVFFGANVGTDGYLAPGI